jgi:hypothetical protein
LKLKQNDWKTLFPVEIFQIGETKLELKPLALVDLPKIIKDFERLRDILAEKEISFNNFGDNLDFIIKLLVSDAPGIVATLSGLDVEDIKRLPLGLAINLTSKCIEVNRTSSKDLVKNLTALVEGATNTMMMTQGILES